MNSLARRTAVAIGLPSVAVVIACSGAPRSGDEPVASTSEAIHVCSPACTQAWTDCVQLTIKGTHVDECLPCGDQGLGPCDASGPDPGCRAQAGGSSPPSLGALGGLCEPCGDVNQLACDSTWQPPNAPQPWFDGCNPSSVIDPGQPLQATGGKCVPCGLPGQPVCACPSAQPSCGMSASVTVGSADGKIGPRFIGLSYEKGVLQQGLFTSSNKPLIALFNLLGPGVLRIGAGGSDGVDAQIPWTAPAVGSDDPLADLAGFVAQTPGWTVLYGLPMLTGCDITEPSPYPAPQAPPSTYCPLATPSTVGKEAAAAASALSSALYGFEIGQEPEGYVYTNAYGAGSPGFANPLDYDSATSTYIIDSTTYSYYLAQWQTLDTAVQAAVSGAVVTGPAASAGVNGATVYAKPFAASAKTEINLLTQHYYYAGADSMNCGRSSPVVGGPSNAWTTGTGSSTCSGQLAGLLGTDPNLTQILSILQSAASTNDIPQGYRISEANSFSGGGLPGISDSQAAALWVIDFLFANATSGSVGVNLHGGGFSDGYTPIADHKDGTVCQSNGGNPTCHLSADPAATPADPAVRPDYYGLLLFSLAGQGNVLATQTTIGAGGVIDFTSHAVGHADGSTSVVLVNKDPTKTVHATVNLATTGVGGKVTLLTAPSLTATSSYTLGGTMIAPTGSWMPATPQPTVNVTGSTMTIDVPPASAALAQVACTTCGGTSCVSLKTDSGNCGACGHSCQGGSCVAGACQAVQLASIVGGGLGVATDGVNVYWSDQSSSSVAGLVQSVPVGGGSVTSLASGLSVPATVAVDHSNVYWLTRNLSFGDNPIYYAPKLGGGPTTKFVAVSYAVGLADDGTNVYWGNVDGDVLQAPVVTASPVTMLSTDAPIAIAVDATNVYWTTGSGSTGGEVRKAPIGGGTVVTLASGLDFVGFYGSAPYSLASDGTKVYWLESDSSGNGRVATTSVSANGGTGTTLTTTSGTSPLAIAVDGANVYWVSGVGAGVSKMAKGGGTTVSLTSNAGGVTIAQDTGAIYWTTSGNGSSPGTGSVYKVAK